ncbi:MAG: fructosamine kinase family protein [Opitutales bacterium]|nr:fructosamine kinase family protein [Opitutales bacterium]
MWNSICQKLSDQLNKPIEYRPHRSVSSGCINNANALETSDGNFFVKANQPERLPMFAAESQGLEAIRASDTVRCPEVHFHDLIDDQAVLVMEFIPMQSAQPESMHQLGSQLAAMHRTEKEYFGWSIDNNIGLTSQKNNRESDWITFFRKHRLEFQMNLCERKGLRIPGKETLLKHLGKFFNDYTPHPSLLHGDLWGGNVGFDEDCHPVLFDPGCYYGDREADLAFTEMFGGFSGEFYKAYEASYPIHKGYSHRKRLYNLYHELNHFYLFGGGYGSQAKETVQFLLGLLNH